MFYSSMKKKYFLNSENVKWATTFREKQYYSSLREAWSLLDILHKIRLCKTNRIKPTVLKNKTHTQNGNFLKKKSTQFLLKSAFTTGSPQLKITIDSRIYIAQ